MKGYGQLCPVAKAAEIFCERWTALIIRDLGAGESRFSELQRGVPLMSRSMLSRRLRELESEHIIERRADPRGRGSIYRLTAAGQEFLPVVGALGAWGERWSRRRVAEGETDCRVLLFDMERSVRREAFGERRTVVQMEFVDQPSQKRRWWFVNEPGSVQLCVKDPGFEIDLYLAAKLADMVALWQCRLAVGRALSERRLRALGTSPLVRALPAWLDRASTRDDGLR